MQFAMSYQMKSEVKYIQILTYHSTFIQTNVSQLKSFRYQYVQAVHNAGSRINFGPLSRSENFEPDFKNDHISRL